MAPKFDKYNHPQYNHRQRQPQPQVQRRQQRNSQPSRLSVLEDEIRQLRLVLADVQNDLALAQQKVAKEQSIAQLQLQQLLHDQLQTVQRLDRAYQRKKNDRLHCQSEIDQYNTGRMRLLVFLASFFGGSGNGSVATSHIRDLQHQRDVPDEAERKLFHDLEYESRRLAALQQRTLPYEIPELMEAQNREREIRIDRDALVRQIRTKQVEANAIRNVNP